MIGTRTMDRGEIPRFWQIENKIQESGLSHRMDYGIILERILNSIDREVPSPERWTRMHSYQVPASECDITTEKGRTYWIASLSCLCRKIAEAFPAGTSDEWIICSEFVGEASKRVLHVTIYEQ